MKTIFNDFKAKPNLVLKVWNATTIISLQINMSQPSFERRRHSTQFFLLNSKLNNLFFFLNRHPRRRHRWRHRDLQHDVGKIVHSCLADLIQRSNPSTTAVKLLPFDHVRWLYRGHLWHTQAMCAYLKVSWWNRPQCSLYPCHWLLHCRHQRYLQWPCSHA